MISAGHRDEYKYWVKADKQIRETGETTLLKEIFENPKHKWGAAVDFPTCVYYKELLKIYPDAKVRRVFQLSREARFTYSTNIVLTLPVIVCMQIHM